MTTAELTHLANWQKAGAITTPFGILWGEDGPNEEYLRKDWPDHVARQRRVHDSWCELVVENGFTLGLPSCREWVDGDRYRGEWRSEIEDGPDQQGFGTNPLGLVG